MTVAVGDEVVVIGGESAPPNAHSEVEAINVYTGQWRKLQDLQIARHAGGVAILNNAIHVIAGNKNHGIGAETDSHEILDFSHSNY